MSTETIRVLGLLDAALAQSEQDLTEMDEALKAFRDECATERVAAGSPLD